MTTTYGGNGRNDDDHPKKATGYKSPPLHGRIKPGEVRNPQGRNGRKKDTGDAFEKARRRASRITVNGETTTVENEEAFWLGQWARAVHNDKSAARLVWQELRARYKLEPAPPSAEELAEQEAQLAAQEEFKQTIIEALELMASNKRRGGGASARVRYGLDGRPVVETPTDGAALRPSNDTVG